MKSFVPGIQIRLSLIALAGYGCFYLLAVYSIITSALKMPWALSCQDKSAEQGGCRDYELQS